MIKEGVLLDPKIIVALDMSSQDTVMRCVRKLSPEHCRVKVGKELFTSLGPKIIEELTALGFSIFLDLKFHDIPATVRKACAVARDLGVWMVNVHASGGRAMIEAAREGVGYETDRPLLIGVTILTSLDDVSLLEIGYKEPTKPTVIKLASLASEAGADGVVCSAQEAFKIREKFGKKFVSVTPGIRPAGTSINDQRRIMTPLDAINLGADYLVIGRPITEASNPQEVVAAINKEIRVAG